MAIRAPDGANKDTSTLFIDHNKQNVTFYKVLLAGIGIFSMSGLIWLAIGGSALWYHHHFNLLNTYIIFSAVSTVYLLCISLVSPPG